MASLHVASFNRYWIQNTHPFSIFPLRNNYFALSIHNNSSRNNILHFRSKSILTFHSNSPHHPSSSSSSSSISSDVVLVPFQNQHLHNHLCQYKKHIHVTSMMYTKKNNNHEENLFMQQMKELQKETIQTTNNDMDADADADADVDADTPSNTFSNYQEQLEEMKQERESLFGFTENEKDAWTNRHDEETMKHLKQIQEQIKLQSLEDDDITNDYDSKNHEVGHDMNTNDHVLEDNRKHGHVFTHLSSEEDDVHMVDVGKKNITRRTAHAQSRVVFPPSVMKAFLPSSTNTNTNTNANANANELIGPKGPIFATAKLAGIMAAKQTSNLIPLCHPLPLEQITITIQLCKEQTNTAIIDCRCTVTHKTGVEMEAMMGASIAALTIYDMVKAVSHEVIVEDVRLVEKRGGKRLVKDGVAVPNASPK